MIAAGGWRCGDKNTGGSQWLLMAMRTARARRLRSYEALPRIYFCGKCRFVPSCVDMNARQ